MKTEPDKGMRYAVLYMTKIPADVKYQFKAYCAKRNQSMTEVIVKLMKDTIKKG